MTNNPTPVFVFNFAQVQQRFSRVCHFLHLFPTTVQPTMLYQLLSFAAATLSPSISSNKMVEVLPTPDMEADEPSTLSTSPRQDTTPDDSKELPSTGLLTPISDASFSPCPPLTFSSSLPSSTTSFPFSSLPAPISPLLHLPPELLLHLTDHLPAPSLLSLRLTCRPLHQLLPPPRKPAETSPCALTACNRHLTSLSDAQDNRARCALCKSLYPLSLFRRAGILSPSLPFQNFATGQSQRIIEEDEVEREESGPGEEDEGIEVATGQGLSHLSDDSVPVTEPRICAWHINRFVFPPTAALAPDAVFDALVSAAGRETGRGLEEIMARTVEAGWASSVEKCCMHCGCIVVCVCSVGECGGCRCDCEGCGVREVRCWWKLARKGYGPKHEGSFGVARGKWLVARAEEAERFGWDGRKLRAEGMVDWGMVRVVKCWNAQKGEVVEGSRKRKAEGD
ncbi:hypothetical protein KVT40_007511 [Elsinoe batatas]|uniref:F-box domain-containing protein n=1 Tax=Elsinoe batatas TaxID=2601811 RepID=A0A8K0KX80_9PEZI|nr:hypothetical protein KVT40_007511 [Elsinoe batatas]